MIKIKASGLRFCQYGLAFNRTENQREPWIFTHYKDGGAVTKCGLKIPGEIAVYVEPKQYEVSVLKTLQELFAVPTMKLKKTADQPRPVISAYGSWFAINANPRPLDNSYSITVTGRCNRK